MSQQDPYGNPPQQPYGQQFGSGPGYPPPPPPPKKRTGLIIGSIVAALVVIGGLVVGGVLLLGDDDKKESSSATDKPSEETTDEPTDEPTSEPTDDPTDEPTDEPTDTGDEVLGTNYTFSLPGADWTDVTADLVSSGTQVDSGVSWGPSIEAGRANVLVEAAPANGTLDENRQPWIDNLQASGGGKPKKLPNVTIDGEPAYAVQRQGTNAAGIDTFQTVYLTVHQEIVYSIAFTSEPADDEAESAFDAIKGSFAWVS